MSLFLSHKEREGFHRFRREFPLGQDLFRALLNRVEERARHPGLPGGGRSGMEWWFFVAEFLSDAAMAHALQPSGRVSSWVRDLTLGLVRRSEEDWVGPPFRDHLSHPPQGHLETAHLTWGVSVVLDLASDVFTADEQEEVRSALRNRGIPLCREWLARNHHLANWRCVLGAGVAVAAAVLNDADEMERALDDYSVSRQVFQPDGSYGESLQYSNYAAMHLMLAREALLRRNPDFARHLEADRWNKLPRWYASSLFYCKALDRWGSTPRARSANFNDSSALFRPSGDLLLHLAAREKQSCPSAAGLARWLFDALYAPDLSAGPPDHASFGFLNDWGFLSVPLLPQATQALDPQSAGLEPLEAFSNGDVLARDRWDGRTIVAIHGGGDPLYGPGHLHGDLNSFILVHNRERLLADPGHSCYRNLLHGLESSSSTHNTCTFITGDAGDPRLQEDQHRSIHLQQTCRARVCFDPSTRAIGPLADRGSRRLLAQRAGDVSVIGSEAARLYPGSIIETFSRFWILCGSHALFIVDRIVARSPVRTTWHWLLNNRDGKLEHRIIHPDRLVARRPGAGMKLFHLGAGHAQTPAYAYLHDVYHPFPNGPGEGRSGSGVLVSFQEPAGQAQEARTTIHAIAMDGYGPVAGWHLKTDGPSPSLESPQGDARWSLHCAADASRIEISETVKGRSWQVFRNKEWMLQETT